MTLDKYQQKPFFDFLRYHYNVETLLYIILYRAKSKMDIHIISYLSVIINDYNKHSRGLGTFYERIKNLIENMR